MIFNTHSDLQGKHAVLSASKHHWINYTDDKMDRVFITQMAAMKGTQLHDLAATLIKMGVKLPNNTKTLNKYVNDAIGFRMEPEKVLVYSYNAFGTADAISFRDGLLRIHDLKTGVIPGSFHQLEIYAAFFCLEYGFKPAEIQIELRIYQSDQVLVFEPDFDEVTRIMGRVIAFDRRITELRAEALG